jgi:S-DNA-T family DNA segregation ATPase FtsK/SpoIIIE
MLRRKKRRRSSSRRQQEPSIWDLMEWQLDTKTTKEILGLLFLLIGLVFLLSIFNLAGPLGVKALSIFKYLWGFYGYIFPLAFFIIGINLLRHTRDEVLRTSVSLGLLFSFIFIPAVAPNIGGSLGNSVSKLFYSVLGPVGGTVVLMILSIISLMVAFNTNLSELFDRFKNENEETGEDEKPLPPKVKVNEPKAPVFVAGQPKPGKVEVSPQQTNFMGALKSVNKDWEFPPFDLLEYSTSKAVSGNINKNVEIIEKTLRDFNIEVTMSEVNIGPTVTQYTLKPADGVKLNQITARNNDMALALAAQSLRVEAPIPGKSAVGIEIPNQKAATVTLREILEDESFHKAKSNLTLALGRDVAGEAVAVDLKRMPHLLIAGSTGSGKSVCINSIIAALLFQNSPNDMRMILVDPKRVEFTEYNGIPHLLAPVITEVDKTVAVLKWAVNEMDRRFRTFAECSRRNIESYNDNPPDNQKMPYIVLVIDELADLMAQAANEVEASIVRLAQMARAVGIHLIVATQRPSVDVITGLIKANMPTRIAFAVASQVDSRTILDQSGAEKLLGRGDMLYLGGEIGQPKRIQGVNIVDKEIKAVTDFLKREGHTLYDESILSSKPGSSNDGKSGDMEFDDDLYQEAKELILQAGKASASLLQRRLRIGYARAARLLDLLESDGVIGPADGSKPRDVLVDGYGGSQYSDDQY